MCLPPRPTELRDIVNSASVAKRGRVVFNTKENATNTSPITSCPIHFLRTRFGQLFLYSGQELCVSATFESLMCVLADLLLNEDVDADQYSHGKIRVPETFGKIQSSCTGM